jgi:hypothetical protein
MAQILKSCMSKVAQFRRAEKDDERKALTIFKGEQDHS